MKKNVGIISYREPRWFKEETTMLSQKWLDSESEQDIVSFILSNASPEYIKEYERASKIIDRAS